MVIPKPHVIKRETTRNFTLKHRCVVGFMFICSFLITTLIFGEALNSPKAVIEKYCRLDSGGANLSTKNFVEKILPFNYWPPGREDNPGSDFMLIVSGYSIEHKGGIRKFNHDVVQFEVEYNVVGLVHGGPGFIEKNEKKVEILEAIKVNNNWKIINPGLPPHVSIETAINNLSKDLTDVVDIEDKKKYLGVINILKAKKYGQ